MTNGDSAYNVMIATKVVSVADPGGKGVKVPFLSISNKKIVTAVINTQISIVAR